MLRAHPGCWPPALFPSTQHLPPSSPTHSTQLGPQLCSLLWLLSLVHLSCTVQPGGKGEASCTQAQLGAGEAGRVLRGTKRGDCVRAIGLACPETAAVSLGRLEEGV